MSAAVGAALKKVLVAILTEPKVLKNVLFAILVVVVAMILPRPKRSPPMNTRQSKKNFPK